MALLRGKDDKNEIATVVKPTKLVPKAQVMVTGRPAFATTLNFERNVSGTTFKVSATEATLKDLVGGGFSNYAGAGVAAKRTDGWLTTELAHDFGGNLTKGKASVKQERDGKTYTLDYTHFVQKGADAGTVDASVKLNGQHKLGASYNLQSQLSALNYTNTPPKNLAGEAWTYNAAVNSKQVVKASATRKRGDTSVAFSYIFPVVVAGEYKHKDFKVTATAPITNEGLGDAKIVASYEPTFLF